MNSSSRQENVSSTSLFTEKELNSLIYSFYSIQEVLASNLSKLPNLRCIISQGHSESVALRVTQIFQICIAFIGIVALLLSLLKFKKKLNFLDLNFKIFVWILCAFAIFHNIFTIIIHLWHQILYIFFKDCDRLIVSWHGVLLRCSQQYGTIGLNVAGAIILFDRILASFRPKQYAKREQQKVIIPFYIGTLFGIPLLTIIYIFHKDVNTVQRSYFTLTSSTSQDQVRNTYLSLLLINILASIGFVILLIKNKKMLKLKAHKFNVNHHFQMLSNIQSLHFSIRLMASSFIINLLSFTINAFYRINYDLKSYYLASFELEASYLMYFHALGIAVVIILNGRSKSSKIKSSIMLPAEEVEIHFVAIQKAWQK